MAQRRRSEPARARPASAANRIDRATGPTHPSVHDRPAPGPPPTSPGPLASADEESAPARPAVLRPRHWRRGPPRIAGPSGLHHPVPDADLRAAGRFRFGDARLLVWPTMDEPAQPVADGQAGSTTDRALSLPPPPFVNPAAQPGESQFVPLSPRVAVLIAAAVIVGLVLWMARDSIRPFILGLLFVYLLDPPVRWLVRRGLRRTLAILVVYVVGIVAFIEFLALTLTPLVDELLRFVNDFPALTLQLEDQLQRLGDFYQRLQIPAESRDWIDSMIAGGSGGGGGGANLSFLLPLVTGASSLIGALFAYFILPVWV